jgi:hypothetical protein
MEQAKLGTLPGNIPSVVEGESAQYLTNGFGWISALDLRYEPVPSKSASYVFFFLRSTSMLWHST